MIVGEHAETNSPASVAPSSVYNAMMRKHTVANITSHLYRSDLSPYSLHHAWKLLGRSPIQCLCMGIVHQLMTAWPDCEPFDVRQQCSTRQSQKYTEEMEQQCSMHTGAQPAVAAAVCWSLAYHQSRRQLDRGMSPFGTQMCASRRGDQAGSPH